MHVGNPSQIPKDGSGLPPSVLRIIEETPAYFEGRRVRLEVQNRKDLASAQKLAFIRTGRRQ